MKLNKTLTALIAGASIGMSGQVLAEGTIAGTSIDNTVTIVYSVSTVLQDTVSQNTNFLVDTKVDFSLTLNETATTKVTPNGDGYYSTYTLQSDSNAELDFTLAALNLTNGSDYVTVYDAAVSDNLDLTATISVFVENEATANGYQPLIDTATDIQNLDPDTNKVIYVVITTAIAAALADGDIAAVSLTATALKGNGDAIPTDENNDVFTPLTQQYVLADADNNGYEVENTAFEVGTATFTDPDDVTPLDGLDKFTLDVTIINDQLCDTTLVNNSTDDYSTGSCANLLPGMPADYIPKAIPRSMVMYTHKAKNTGSVDGEGVVFSQDLTNILDNDGDLNLDLISNTLNVKLVNFTDGSGGAPTGTAIDTSDGNVLTITVDVFEPNDVITIEFTARVE